jgi:hypothetical protein
MAPKEKVMQPDNKFTKSPESLMKYLSQTGLLLSCLWLVGCGGGDTSMDVPAAPPAQPTVAPQVQAAPPAAAPVSAPPTGAAPAALEPAPPDVFTSYKATPDGKTKTDIEAMQAVVDGYAFGVDGLGAPPLNSLDDLVTKGYLKRLPPAPSGMKWAYDSVKWKVSVVPQ